MKLFFIIVIGILMIIFGNIEIKIAGCLLVATQGLLPTGTESFPK